LAMNSFCHEIAGCARLTNFKLTHYPPPRFIDSGDGGRL
jgi:hypothetical protein